VKKARFFVGTSGWSYNHWRGLFYPVDMPPRRWFAHYYRHFSTVEINYTFYRLPAEKTFVRWREESPAQLVYALKAPRTITHFRKLRRTEGTLDRFLERARLLGSKLGPSSINYRPTCVSKRNALLNSWICCPAISNTPLSFVTRVGTVMKSSNCCAKRG